MINLRSIIQWTLSFVVFVLSTLFVISCSWYIKLICLYGVVISVLMSPPIYIRFNPKYFNHIRLIISFLLSFLGILFLVLTELKFLEEDTLSWLFFGFISIVLFVFSLRNFTKWKKLKQRQDITNQHIKRFGKGEIAPNADLSKYINNKRNTEKETLYQERLRSEKKIRDDIRQVEILKSTNTPIPLKLFWYYCNQCNLLVKQNKKPLSTLCLGSNNVHHFVKIADVGDKNFYCKECNIQVSSPEKPMPTHCCNRSFDGWHHWVKL